MPAFLTHEWIEGLPDAVGELGVPDAVIAFEIGAAKFSWTVTGGRIVETAHGPRADADVTFSATEQDARDLIAGDPRPDTAFMRGRLKAAGAMDIVLSMLQWSTTDDYATVRARVAAMTD